MDYLTGKKDETKQKAGDTLGVAKEKYEETKEDGSRKMGEMKIGGEKTEAPAESIWGVKEKVTPQMEGHGTRVSYGGTGEAKAGHRLAVDEEGVPVVVKMEGTTAGAVAAALKEADQMTGQTFNDVGLMGDDGVTRVKEDRTGKM
ncbi:hypothetical protein CASFOL_009391 [Castilleja foliolosa]|uniref:LEA protein n=1 Tax=Castilleja foliolosa TaxID=1961234 RepID=A0ABD3DZ16_9LAMI